MAVWCVCIACWITKARNTDTEYAYVIPFAFALQQWLHEHALVLCLYIHCLSCQGLGRGGMYLNLAHCRPSNSSYGVRISMHSSVGMGHPKTGVDITPEMSVIQYIPHIIASVV